MNFDQAFEILLKHEGGFVDHAADPGGKTRYGITEAVARAAGYDGDMRELPVDFAKQIYIDRYWIPVKAEQLPAPVRYAVFDASVNSGVGQSIKWLQRAVGVRDDGVLGPITLAAVQAADSERLLRRLLSARLRFITDLKAWPAFGRGWSRRIADLLEA